MTNFYIAANGSSSNNGTSESTPWANPDNASGKTFASGDKVLIRTGDTFTCTKTIAPAMGVTWDRYGDVNKPRPVLHTHAHVWVNKADVKVKNLDIRSNGYGIKIVTAPDALIEDC